MSREPKRSLEPIERRRLLRLVRRRYDFRVVALVAGAGFGKSTLVRQAIADNVSEPSGLDVCIECTADDAHLSEFAARIRTLFELDSTTSNDPERLAAAVADAVALRSPIDVCLIIDDAHLLTGSHSWTLVREIADRLPPNGHLLIAVRTDPDLPLARLAARGHALLIDEEELSFTVEECMEFGRRRGVDFTNNPIAWPALAELAARSSGPRLQRAYLVQEVVETLSPSVRQLLGAVVVAEGADDALASAMIGRPVNVEHELHGVPLVHPDSDGWVQPHELWRNALADLLSPDDQLRSLNIAAAMLAGRGRYVSAIRLYTAAGNWTAAGRVALSALGMQPPAIDPAALARLLDLVPMEERGHPGWQLAGALLTYERSLGAARTALERLVEHLSPGGPSAYELSPQERDDALVSALFHLATIGRRMADEDLLASVTEQLGPFVQQRHARATAVSASVKCFMAQIHGRCAEGLEALEDVDHGSISREQSAHVLLMAGNLHLLDDRPDLASACYREASDEANASVRVLADELHATATWVAGHIDEAIEEERRCLDAAERFGFASRAAQFRAMLAAMLAMAGRLEESQAVFDALPVQLGSHSADMETRTLSQFTLALFDLAAGDRAGAVETLTRIPEPDGHLQRASFMPAATIVALLPERRAAWNAIPARLIQAAAESGRRLADPTDPTDATEAADGAAYPESLSFRRALVPAALAPATTRQPVVHSDQLHLDVLGTVRLQPLADPVPWRRGRVRELAAAIALLGPCRRETLAEMLWPDQSAGVADRNLRVNLTYLADAVDPDRPRGMPSSLLVAQGTSLAIADARVQVDLVAFDECRRRARAAEQDNDPATALVALSDGVALWRGEVAADLDAEWLEPIRRQRGAEFVAMASRAGEIALGQGELEQALAFTSLVLARDPSHERAGRLRAVCLLAAGDRSAATEVMRGCLARCAELGVEPEPETVVVATRLGIDVGCELGTRRLT